MAPKVGSKQQVTYQKTNYQKSAAKPEPKAPVPVGQRTTTTATANTNGAPAEMAMDGQTGQVVYNIGVCNDCEFTVNVDNHVEVQGDNNGQISTGDQSPNVTTKGNNSPAGVTYGDGSDVNQATGKNAKIVDETVINNVQQAPAESQPTVKQETKDVLKKLGLPQADIDRLVEQDEYIQSHIKADMTSVRSKCIIEEAKITAKHANYKGEEYRNYMNYKLEEAKKQSTPSSLNELMENKSFNKLPKQQQLAYLQSGLPAAAIADICEIGFDFAQLDKENNQLKIGCMRNGVAIKFDVSNKDRLNNVRIGMVDLPKFDGKNNVENEIRIQGIPFEPIFGFNSKEEFGDTNPTAGYKKGIPMLVTVGRRAQVTGVTVNRPGYDRIRFEENADRNECLEGETVKNIRHNFNVNINDSAKTNGAYRNGYLLTAQAYYDNRYANVMSGIHDGDNIKINMGQGDLLMVQNNNNKNYKRVN